jgi:SAM-dependent methyltransferase
MSPRAVLGRWFFGQRFDLGHGSERQAAGWLWGIRVDHRQRYAFASRYIGSGTVLDVACGVGYGSYMLGRDDPGRTVVGRDRCARTVAFARRTYCRANVSFECGEALDIRQSEAFDAVVSLETLEHIADEDGFLVGLRRAARRHCTLVISTPNQSRYPFRASYNPHHVRHHTPEELDRLLADTGWKVTSRHCQQDQQPGRVVPGVAGRFLIYVATPN